MTDLINKLQALELTSNELKEDVVKGVRSSIEKAGFTIVEEDTGRPWGAFFRLENKDANVFVGDFFTDLSLEEARLGNPDAELSPKILLVSPGQRLSWQYHNRRAERWKFINDGGYHRSLGDDQGSLVNAQAGDVVQFDKAERHRLVASENHYTVVAEIWQHTNPDEVSNEDDIIRLQDDYHR
jgi:mannose-6-phosphate isomerase